MKNVTLLIALLGANLSWAQVGSLQVLGEEYKANIDGKVYKIETSERIKAYLDTFDTDRSMFKFEGSIEAETYKLSKVPQIASGREVIGTFVSFSTGNYLEVSENGLSRRVPVKLKKGVDYMGNSFDQKSADHYSGKKVRVLINGEQEISAIVEQDLYSAKTNNAFALSEDVQKLLDANPLNFTMKEMPKNRYQQRLKSFRATIQGKEHQVKEGDLALVVTLAGRQGDDPTAVGGHFAVGKAKVNQDLSLDMEISNFYPGKNGKDIIPGHIHHLDYFGGISSGQTNYRPQMTAIIYGMTEADLDKMRKRLDPIFAHMRTTADPGGVNFNCTTASWKGLRKMKVRGTHNRGIKALRKILVTNPFYFIGKRTAKTRQLSYIIAQDKGEFLPRSAFNSFLKGLKFMKNSPSRVDLVFHAQLPSNRPIGGTAIDQLKEYTKADKIEKQRIEENRGVEWVKEQLDQIVD